MDHFGADFRGKGASPTNHAWYQSSRVIALSCNIKMSAVRHLVLSQSTRVTDRRTDGQNYDSQDRPGICSRGKNQYDVITPSAIIRVYCKDFFGLHNTPFSSLPLFSPTPLSYLFLPCPSLPYHPFFPLRSKPLNPSGSRGALLAPAAGSRAEPQPKLDFGAF